MKSFNLRSINETKQRNICQSNASQALTKDRGIDTLCHRTQKRKHQSQIYHQQYFIIIKKEIIMKTITMLSIAIMITTMLSCSNTSEPIKTTTQLQNPLMPLTVGNWWKYQKRFGYDTTEFTMWRVTNVQGGNGSITATIAYHTYLKGKEQDTLTSGIFYVHENDSVLYMGATASMLNTIPNKTKVYRSDSTDSRITQHGMYLVGKSDSLTVPAGTFYDVLTFGEFDKNGYPLWIGDAGEFEMIKPSIGVVEILVSWAQYKLVEYSLISNI